MSLVVETVSEQSERWRSSELVQWGKQEGILRTLKDAHRMSLSPCSQHPISTPNESFFNRFFRERGKHLSKKPRPKQLCRIITCPRNQSRFNWIGLQHRNDCVPPNLQFRKLPLLQDVERWIHLLLLPVAEKEVFSPDGPTNTISFLLLFSLLLSLVSLCHEASLDASAHPWSPDAHLWVEKEKEPVFVPEWKSTPM